MEETNNDNTEKPFCLLWDLERKEYARVESPWSDQDLKSVARFEVRERFKTEEELIDALKRAKIIEENKKSIGKMAIIGAGNFARTIMHGDAPSPVILVDSKVDALSVHPFETPSTPIFNPYSNNPDILNIDHDFFPVKRKGKTNYTAPKKKRKK